jgi:hypothetical protein
MKKIFTLLAILSFFFLQGQNGLFGFEQYKNGVVYYKNGDTIKGLIKKRMLNGIKFKDSPDSKPVKLNYVKISGFDTKYEKYRYKKEKKSSPKLVEIILIGKINLYSETNTSGGMLMSGGGTFNAGSSTTYFIEKDNEFIKLGKRIKKKHMAYFNDCSILIEKINRKIISRYKPIKIIEFYNQECK